MTDTYCHEDSTPAYPKFGATVAKLRKLPRTPENIKKHFDALMSQLATMNRRAVMSDATATSPCPCASGTWHSDGDKILAAISDQHRRAAMGALAESWRLRTDAQVRAAYELAMEGKDSPLTRNIYVPRKY